MSLLPGTRLGPYEIVGVIGAGGMGEVYRGLDTRLDRPVAVKVLPDEVAFDPDRLARFEREAKTLAALNHPNIAQIYGLEGSALVMELVEGEDLSTRIARGSLPLDEAMAIAGQIALALETAHELGIIHRDLKSSNIRIRPDGAVKVLDFGLAKALASPVDLFDTGSAATITSPTLTHQGVILGTAAYMSPEQARGKPVDKRADIWAFGVVLYEMVTGRRPFDGETVTESIAGLLKSEPDWSPVPAELRRLLRSCLEKDPKTRLRDIGDWRRQFDEPAAAVNAPIGRWLSWGVSAVLAVIAGGLATVHYRETPAAALPVALQIPPPPKNTFEMSFPASPDGRRIAFTAKDAEGVVRIWIRDLDAIDSRPIAGTEGARSISWSPDGQSLAFAVGRFLKRVPIEGGPALTIFEAESEQGLGGAAWSPHGMVVGGTRGGAMRFIREAGGPVVALTSIDKSRSEFVHGLAAFLPDGRHFLYARVGIDPETSGIYVGSIDAKPEEQPLTRLLATSHAIFMKTAQGQDVLLYLRGTTLVAHPFDTERLRLLGDPSPISDGVGSFGAFGFFSAHGGTVAYRTGAAKGRGSQLTWVDRNGKTLGVVGGPTSIDGLRLSPDGTRAAVVQVGSAEAAIGNVDIWLVEVTSGVPQRLTSGPAMDRWPVWSTGGDRMVWQSGSELYVASTNGTGEPTKLPVQVQYPRSWSRDGRFLLFTANSPATSSDIWLLPLEGDRKPVLLVQTTFNEGEPAFSPDMKWIAYHSNATGRMEIYVRSFNPASPASAPGAGPPISKNGGRFPKWRRDGRELFYQDIDDKLIAVDVTPDGNRLRFGEAKPLFDLPSSHWDVSPDGRRILVSAPPVESGLTPITVLTNWRRK